MNLLFSTSAPVQCLPVLPFHTYCRPADLWMDLRPTLNCFSTLLRCLPVLPCQIRDRDELSGQHRCVVSRHCLTIPVAVLSSFERIRDLDELACQHLPVLWCFPVLPCCTGCRPAALWMATRPTSTCFSALLRCLTVLPCRTCYRPADLWMDLRPTPTCFSALLYCLPVLPCRSSEGFATNFHVLLWRTCFRPVELRMGSGPT